MVLLLTQRDDRYTGQDGFSLLVKYVPPAKVSKLKSDIITFAQLDDESIHDWLSWNLHTENTKFQEYRIEVQVLNATAIASGYAGRDPHGGTSDGSFL